MSAVRAFNPSSELYCNNVSERGVSPDERQNGSEGRAAYPGPGEDQLQQAIDKEQRRGSCIILIPDQAKTSHFQEILSLIGIKATDNAYNLIFQSPPPPL